MPSHDMTEQDTARHAASHVAIDDEERQNYEEKIKELESNHLNLRIDNNTKEHVITRLTEELRKFVRQPTEQSRAIGRLETELLAL